MKVTIRKWNAVATWRWDIPEDDVCGICQVHFDGTCPTCKYPGDDCSLCEPLYTIAEYPKYYVSLLIYIPPSVSGKCGHNFHMVRKTDPDNQTAVVNLYIALHCRMDKAGLFEGPMPNVQTEYVPRCFKQLVKHP
jgi:anaphase-promoting complex subunit 11